MTVPGLFDETNHYEIEPCGKLVSSCGGAVCHVSKTVKESLGHLTSMIYDENLDAIKVDYKEGSICNSITKKKWTSKIYYYCDPDKGLGEPEIDDTFNCAVFFNWRTSLVCNPEPGVNLPSNTGTSKTFRSTTTISPHRKESTAPVSGGSSSSSWILLLFFLVIIVTGAVLYVKPAYRERVYRVYQGTKARLPVFMGGRSREDTTLLVSDGRMTASGFGAMSVDEEFG